MKLTKLINIVFTVLLLNFSGCAIINSNTESAGARTANAAKEAAGAVIVNASENNVKGKRQLSENIHASCNTEYSEKSGGRAHNVKLAASKLNGMTISPDEIFSFNEALGPAGKSNGYKKARIFVRGQDAEGYGGGICQLSSALYVCALDLGLNIIERHPHSKPVGYVERDKDAATSYGGKDLKFENTLKKTLKITASAKDGVLNVSLSQ